MSKTNFAEDVHFEGNVSFGGAVGLPVSCVGNTQVKDTDPIESDKVESQFALTYAQEEGAALVSATKILHVCKGAGEVLGISASFGSVIPTGNAAAESITVQVVKHTAAVPDDVMTAVIQLDDGNVVYTPEDDAGLDGTGKITAVNDILEVVVTKVGAEVVARGLVVRVSYKEVSVT